MGPPWEQSPWRLRWRSACILAGRRAKQSRAVRRRGETISATPSVVARGRPVPYPRDVRGDQAQLAAVDRRRARSAPTRSRRRPRSRGPARRDRPRRPRRSFSTTTTGSTRRFEPKPHQSCGQRNRCCAADQHTNLSRFNGARDGRDLQGRALATTHWLASVTVAFYPPTDERGVLSNPLRRLYVTAIRG